MHIQEIEEMAVAEFETAVSEGLCDLSPSDYDDLISSATELRAVRFTQSDIDSAVVAEREACARAVRSIRLMADRKYSPDLGVNGWLQEAERAILMRPGME